MRRAAAIAVVLVGVVAALVTTGASGPGGDAYEVRAVFDNAAHIVEGEDVKIAGARVGKVKELDVTPVDPDDAYGDKKAIVVLSIEEEGFAPFKADAECSIRPQSLIGEKFVECDPGVSQEELVEVPEGEEGAGQDLLPVERNHTPVDLDLINNTLRLPYRERLALIINEFGAGLAGRGQELNEAIHRANPALRETDELLAILAEQNKTLGRLAEDSDEALAPIARDRERVQGFIERGNEVAQASAERRDDIEASFERLPVFLPELRGTLADLGAFTDEMEPVLSDLGDAAPDFNRFIRALAPFSRAGLPAFRTLGEATEDGRPALDALRPVVGDLRDFTRYAKPTSRNLELLTTSFDNRGGIEYLMDYLFFQMTAINGFDGVSHYLRAQLITNLCTAYATNPVGGCSANFTATRSVQAADGPEDQSLKSLRRLLRGQPDASVGESAKPIGADPVAALESLSDPEINRQREEMLESIRRGAERGGGQAGGASPDEAALDYLLGADR